MPRVFHLTLAYGQVFNQDTLSEFMTENRTVEELRKKVFSHIGEDIVETTDCGITKENL